MLEWREIPGWPAYEISEVGDIRRVRQGQSGNGKVGRLLRPSVGPKGYLRATLYSGSTESRTQIGVHVLVALAFHGPRPTPEHQVAHGDGDPSNNHWRNVRWATPAENCADRVLHGTAPIGEAHWHAELSADDVREIRRVYAENQTGSRVRRGTAIALAQRLGVTPRCVALAANGYTWRHLP